MLCIIHCNNPSDQIIFFKVLLPFPVNETHMLFFLPAPAPTPKVLFDLSVYCLAMNYVGIKCDICAGVCFNPHLSTPQKYFPKQTFMFEMSLVLHLIDFINHLCWH